MPTKVLAPLFLLPLLLITMTSGVPVAAQERSNQEPIRLTTTLIPVTFAVKDKKGNFVQDLQKEDFQVFEDGGQQRIEFFDTNPFFINKQEPLAVALVLNWNPNTLRSHSKLAIAALASWQQSLPDNTVMGLFVGEGCTIQWFTNNKTLLQAASKLLAELAEKNMGCGGARFYPNLIYATQQLSEVPRTQDGRERRKVIFIVSDEVTVGGPAAPHYVELNDLERLRYIQAWRTVKENKVTPYAGIIRYYRGLALTLQRERHPDYDAPLHEAERLFDDAGGRILELDVSLGETEAFRKAFAELQQSYQLSYVPTPNKLDGKFHRIKLRLRRPGLESVGVREGYWALTPEEAAREKQAFAQSVFPTGSDSSDMSPIKLKYRRSGRRDTLDINDPVIRLDRELKQPDEGIAPLRSELGVEDQSPSADGSWTATFSLYFDFQSLRVIRSIGGRNEGEGAAWRSPLYDHANLDIWLEVFKEGEVRPLRRLQTTLNIFADYKLFPEFQRKGVSYKVPLTLQPGKYTLRMVAREPLSGRLARLNEAIEVSDQGIKYRSLRSDAEAGYPERLLDRLPSAPAAEAATKSPRAETSEPKDESLNLALLIDAHELMRRKHLETIASGVRQCLSSLKSTDRIGVVAINSHATQVLDFTQDHKQAAEAVAHILLSPSDQTAINDYEAIYHTARQMMQQVSGGRVMIWLTDLNDNFRGYADHAIFMDILKGPTKIYYKDHALLFAPYDEAVKSVQAAGAKFYAVVLPDRFSELSSWEATRNERKNKLRKLAEATGGQLMTIRQIEELPMILSRIVSEQRNR